MKTTRPINAGLLLLTTFTTLPQCALGDFRIEIVRAGTNVLLTWTNAPATLETSLAVTGGWSPLSSATSPYRIPATNVSSFYRLRLPGGGPFDFRYLAPTFTTGIGDPFGGCGCTAPENPNSLAAGGNPQDNGLGSVFLHTGELTQHEVDLAIPGRGFDWKFERRYRSGMNYDGPLGHGWDFNYNQRLAVQANGDVLRVDGLGRVDRYVFSGGAYQSPSGFYTRLVRNPDGTFDQRDRHGTVHSYSATNTLGIARLTHVRDRNGNEMTFDYNPLGQLTNVVDTLGRSITYGYDGNGRLAQVTDFTGRILQFGYDANGNLTSVTSPAVTGTPNGNDFPLGKSTRYAYSGGYADARLNHNLLSVTAPNEVAASGPPRLVAQYDTNPASTNADRVVSVVLGGANASGVGAGGRITFAYAGLGSAPSNDFSRAVFATTVTNRNGNVAEYRFNQLGNIVWQKLFTRGLRPAEPRGFTNQFEYNRDGETTRRVFPAGNSTEYIYDRANPDRFQQGNLLQTRRLPGPRGGHQPQLVTSMTYETNFNFVLTSTDARGNTTTHAYDSAGNRTNTLHRIPGITERREYNAFGQMTAHVLPDNGIGTRRRDVLTYYSSGPQLGYLQSRVVDRGGFNLTTTYEYDAAGNVIRVVDPRGNDTLYTINALNQVVREQSALFNTSSGPVRYQREFFYDANDNLVRSDVENRDENGLLDLMNPAWTTSYAYDMLDDRLSTTQEVDAASRVVTAYAYDPNQNPSLTRFGEATAGRQTNNVVQRIYDERDLVFREIRGPGSADQSTTRWDYDPNGNPDLSREGIEDTTAPRVTFYAYDGYDRRVAVTDPMGNSKVWFYDANQNVTGHQVVGETNDLPDVGTPVVLRETIAIFDPMDRLVRADVKHFDPITQSAIGDGWSSTETIFSDASQVLAVIDDNRHGTTNRYDSANRLASVTDAKGNSVSYTYDANGNAATTTEIDKSDLGNADQTFLTRYTYDALDRRVQTVDNLGNTNQQAYDSRHNRTRTQDGRGNVTRSAFDGLNRALSTVRLLTGTGDGSGPVTGAITTRQAWDDSSRLILQTDDNTNTTAYAYDALNRLVLTLYADGTGQTNTYDAHDNRIAFRDGNGNVVTSDFDLNNRIVTNRIQRGRGVLGTTNELYRYDGLSRVVQAQNDGSLVTRSYDSLSRVLRETQQVLPGGVAAIVAATFDGEGNRTRLVYPGGRVLVTVFDPLNLPVLTRDDPPGPRPYVAADRYRGRRLEQRDYGNGTRLEMFYDPLRRPVETRHSGIGGLPFEQRLSAWDAADNKTQSLNPLAAPPPDDRFYTYDSVDRLIRTRIQTPAVPPPTTYQLDGAGNRVAVTGSIDPGNYQRDATRPEPADFQMNQYTRTPVDEIRRYDHNGNLIVTTNSGTLNAPPPKSLGYDFRNELVRFESQRRVTSYRYDCFGRRIEKQEPGGVTRFLYAGWHEIEEQNTNGGTLATMVWDGRGGLLSRSAGGQSYFYHADDLGSVRKVTDAAGRVVEQYDYGDYGMPTVFDAVGRPRSGSAIGNDYLFRGHFYDTESRLSRVPVPRNAPGDIIARVAGHRSAPLLFDPVAETLRNASFEQSVLYWRHLDSDAGRFLTRDPMGDWTDGLNLGNGFTYAGNNPAIEYRLGALPAQIIVPFSGQDSPSDAKDYPGHTGPPANPQPQVVRILTREASVRRTASSVAKRLVVLEENDPVTILERRESWARIRAASGIEGWIESSSITRTPTSRSKAEALGGDPKRGAEAAGYTKG